MFWIQTYTGKKYNFADPTPEMISIYDIAHHLSLITRFNGASRLFYSVAQHSVECARQAIREGLPLNTVKWAFLHDSSEAYVGDMTRPLKKLIPQFSEYEELAFRAITQKFGIVLDNETLASVKQIDNRMLYTEGTVLMHDMSQWTMDVSEPYPDVAVVPMTPEESEKLFLKMYSKIFYGNPDLINMVVQ